MHLVGKILIVLLAIAAGIGFITGARLVNARGAWTNLLQVAKANDEKSCKSWRRPGRTSKRPVQISIAKCSAGTTTTRR